MAASIAGMREAAQAFPVPDLDELAASLASQIFDASNGVALMQSRLDELRKMLAVVQTLRAAGKAVEPQTVPEGT